MFLEGAAHAIKKKMRQTEERRRSTDEREEDQHGEVQDEGEDVAGQEEGESSMRSFLVSHNALEGDTIPERLVRHMVSPRVQLGDDIGRCLSPVSLVKHGKRKQRDDGQQRSRKRLMTDDGDHMAVNEQEGQADDVERGPDNPANVSEDKGPAEAGDDGDALEAEREAPGEQSGENAATEPERDSAEEATGEGVASESERAASEGESDGEGDASEPERRSQESVVTEETVAEEEPEASDARDKVHEVVTLCDTEDEERGGKPAPRSVKEEPMSLSRCLREEAEPEVIDLESEEGERPRQKKDKGKGKALARAISTPNRNETVLARNVTFMERSAADLSAIPVLSPPSAKKKDEEKEESFRFRGRKKDLFEEVFEKKKEKTKKK